MQRRSVQFQVLFTLVDRVTGLAADCYMWHARPSFYLNTNISLLTAIIWTNLPSVRAPSIWVPCAARQNATQSRKLKAQRWLFWYMWYLFQILTWLIKGKNDKTSQKLLKIFFSEAFRAWQRYCMSCCTCRMGLISIVTLITGSVNWVELASKH